MDYGVTIGQSVMAPASGVVTFAGLVAGTRWIVVLHPDGRRSSLGPVAAPLAPVGQHVQGGDVIAAAAGDRLHWGVREATVYVNPLTLLPPPGVGPSGKLRLTQ